MGQEFALFLISVKDEIIGDRDPENVSNEQYIRLVTEMVSYMNRLNAYAKERRAFEEARGIRARSNPKTFWSWLWGNKK